MSESRATNGTPHARPRLHHVNLKTTRLDEMIRWYREVVGGLDVTFAYPDGAWLTNDDANHRIALMTSPALGVDGDKFLHAGLHHVAFEFDTLDALLDTYVRLAEVGIVPHFTVDHGMTTSFYYADPDGNSVELQVDNFGDWARSTEWMRSAPEFAADPRGSLVDPQRMIEARTAGTSAEEIHRRAYAGELVPDGPMDPHWPSPRSLNEATRGSATRGEVAR